MPWVQCVQCQRWFVGHHTATLCSAVCRHQRYLAKVKESNAKRYLPIASFVCAECGILYTTRPGGGSRKRYCSTACSERAGRRTERHRRRARLSGDRERFTLLEIAVRDGWRCHICHRKVSRKTWSLDHLIPVSQGGPHTRANVALAHRACNGRRGATGPAQLLLLG